ncbi:carbohydrate binding domain-containing protein [Halobacillus mangrovi]|nr:carbohydrate binding domain-containing protein [Halobacillus mangrovi]
MNKIFCCFMAVLIVLGSFSPVQAEKSSAKNGEAKEYKYESEWLDGLKEQKTHQAAMSYQEYATFLGNLFGVETAEVIQTIEEVMGQQVNLNKVIKQEEAKEISDRLLPSQLENEFNQHQDSDKPVKRLDVLSMAGSFVKGYYGKKGKYEGEKIKGNAWINHSNVTLSKSTINGDLVITSGKNIVLEEITVTGTVYIDHSIQNNVLTIDSDLNDVRVFDASKENSDWSLVWADEFISNQIDRTKWDYDIGNWIIDEDGEPVAPGWGNNELEYYTDSSENSFTEDGKLVIRAQKEEEPIEGEYGTYDYTSAKLKTKGLFSKKYGKFEAKMKLPEGQGYWPAFWMMPEDDVYGAWPVSGEIDIMEAAGGTPHKIGGTIHYGEEYPNNTYTSGDYHFPDGEDITGYHTYSVEWEPGEIRWYVDGKLYQTLNDWFSKGTNQADKYAYPAPFDQEFYMILNLAVGGWYGGNPDETTEFPGEMEVDYVRVYELTGRDYKEPVEPVVEDEELPEDAKQPLEDGNLIYDQSYQEPITIVDQPEDSLDPTFWNFLKLPQFEGKGTIEATEVDGERFAKTTIENPGNALWSLQQIQKIAILKGHTYEVTFDAKSNTNRNLMTKVSGGAERGYANYSGEKTFQLSDEVQSYNYTFTLNQDTDLAARLEFNMGSNGLAPVWIGNVRVEDVTDQQVEETSKSPLSDGNRIYNGTFDQGDMTRLNYWELHSQEGASAEVSVSPETREAEIEPLKEGEEADDILFKQTGIQLQEGQEYELTFHARAEDDRTVQVDLVSQDGSENFSSEVIDLTKEMKSHTVTFQMPDNTTDLESQLLFKLGGQSEVVYLDDVRLIQTSNQVELQPLKNGDFANGMEAWSPYIHYDAQANVSAINEMLKVDIENGGNETWSVLVEQPGLALSKNITYTLSFKAKSTNPRDIEVTMENAAYHRYLSEVVSLTDEMQTYEFEWDMTEDDTTSLKFLMGKFADSHEISIDDISLEVK